MATIRYVAKHAGASPAGVIVTITLVIMVLIFQRRIVEGLTSGATK